MKLSDFIVRDAIIPELSSTDRNGVIGELVQSLVEAKAMAPGEANAVIKAILAREKIGSTGMGMGVAVPHAKHPAIKKQMGGVGRSVVGVDFSALDRAPVYSVILLLSPPDQPDLHLQAMEKLFHSLQEDMFRRFLRQSDTRDKICDLLEEADQANTGR